MTKRIRITDLNGKETRYFTSNYMYDLAHSHIKGKYLPIIFPFSGEHELALTIRYVYEMRNCILLRFKELGDVK